MTQPVDPAGGPLTTSGADLLRGAAHLLRTPLGVVLGMSATLRDYDHRFTAEQRTLYLGEVFKAAEEMRIALDGMSLLARLVAGTLPFSPALVPISSLLRRAAEALGPIWGEGTAAVMPAPDDVVRADEQRFGQAVDALARVFAPAAGVSLSAVGGTAPQVRLGPVTIGQGSENIDAFAAPYSAIDLAGVVARPGGWAALAARYLLEGQGASMQTRREGTDPADGTHTLVIALPLDNA